MRREAHLELLRMAPTEDGQLEPQYCWRYYDIPDAQDLVDACEEEA